MFFIGSNTEPFLWQLIQDVVVKEIIENITV